MTEKSISSQNGSTTLTVVAVEKKTDGELARLIPINKPASQPVNPMHPQPEMYIKAKKHDFL